VSLQTKNAAIKTVNLAMVFGTPPMTACVIFASYEMLVGRLSATLAFTTLSLFNILRFPLVVLPKAMRALSEALASIERVEAFLLEAVPTDSEGITKANRAGVSIVSGAPLVALQPEFISIAHGSRYQPWQCARVAANCLKNMKLALTCSSQQLLCSCRVCRIW